MYCMKVRNSALLHALALLAAGPRPPDNATAAAALVRGAASLLSTNQPHLWAEAGSRLRRAALLQPTARRFLAFAAATLTPPPQPPQQPPRTRPPPRLTPTHMRRELPRLRPDGGARLEELSQAPAIYRVTGLLPTATATRIAELPQRLRPQRPPLLCWPQRRRNAAVSASYRLRLRQLRLAGRLRWGDGEAGSEVGWPSGFECVQTEAEDWPVIQREFIQSSAFRFNSGSNEVGLTHAHSENTLECWVVASC